jgi:hypothetical protein
MDRWTSTYRPADHRSANGGDGQDANPFNLYAGGVPLYGRYQGSGPGTASGRLLVRYRADRADLCRGRDTPVDSAHGCWLPGCRARFLASRRESSRGIQDGGGGRYGRLQRDKVRVVLRDHNFGPVELWLMRPCLCERIDLREWSVRRSRKRTVLHHRWRLSEQHLRWRCMQRLRGGTTGLR